MPEMYSIVLVLDTATMTHEQGHLLAILGLCWLEMVAAARLKSVIISLETIPISRRHLRIRGVTEELKDFSTICLEYTSSIFQKRCSGNSGGHFANYWGRFERIILV